ncbi:hypothetical protein WA026_003613 [Henosepilachna vigintioctopunctata]|uniref:Uncharacterized protein n=1 Tax=Henosepilachna vigintioctopunctata TaxID=420089 RepID=A0AAW1TMM0_9CUCU
MEDNEGNLFGVAIRLLILENMNVEQSLTKRLNHQVLVETSHDIEGMGKHTSHDGNTNYHTIVTKRKLGLAEIWNNFTLICAQGIGD